MLGSVAILGLALRAYVRYLIPWMLLSAIVFAPALWTVRAIPLPGDGAQARASIMFAWTVAGVAWIAQLLLVAGVAPGVRAVGQHAAISQVRSLGAGLTGLVRMVLPCLLAVAAIGLGMVAVVVPGFILLVLLSLTGASTERALPAPLLDSIAVVRRNRRAVVLAVAAMLVLDLGLPAVLQLAIGSIPKQPTPDQLEACRQLARIVIAGLVIVSPLLASVLAAIHVRAREAD